MSHDAWLEQADVYAVGALDGEELARFEAHLASGCAACGARLREARQALALLPRALPPVEPPPALRARVLERVAGDPGGARAPVRLHPERRRRALRWVGWAGLAAAAVLLVAVNRELAETRREVADLRGRMATLQADLADREETLRLLSDPGVRYVSLAGLEAARGASAWLLWNPASRTGLLLARGLPSAPPERAYELWAIAGAEPVPAGVFTVDAAGRALLRVPPLPGGASFDTFAVTLEPAGGVPKPTGPMLLAGKL